MNREKSIFEQMGGTYVLRKSYLKDHKTGWYQSMLLTGKLDKHLVDIDEQARERFERIIEQMKRV